MDEISCRPPGKLNLYLHVVGRRRDGYHLLDSLVAFTDLADTLTVAPSDTLELAVDGPFAAAAGPVPDNLVLRAARLLAEAAGVQDGASIRLTKTIPVAAGLGGGSSDAAAALRLLPRLWRVENGEPALAELALRLGADVPVCLYGRAAFVGGIGDRIEPAPRLPTAQIVLVNPGVRLATAEIYRGRGGEFSTADRFDQKPRDFDSLVAALGGRRNDLQEAAVARAPVVADVLARLAAEEGCHLARMSGSGATCFGLFADATGASRAASRIAADRPGWWVRATRLKTGEEDAWA